MASSYQVDVIHFINPHLLWVAVEKDGVIKYEQVGVYGVLPTKPYVDVNEKIHSDLSDEWLPGVAVQMQELLDTAREVYFWPVHVDKRSVIFPDIKIHTYGEFTVTRPNGKKVKLSKFLCRSFLALYSEDLFLVELANRKLIPKISDSKKEQVRNGLKKYKSLLAPQLTVESLELHNKINDAEADLKIKDYDLREDSDHEGLGRGTKHRQHKVDPQKRYTKTAPKTDSKYAGEAMNQHEVEVKSPDSSTGSLLLKKKLMLASKQNDSQDDPNNMVLATKRLFLNLVKRNKVDSESSRTNENEKPDSSREVNNVAKDNEVENVENSRNAKDEPNSSRQMKNLKNDTVDHVDSSKMKANDKPDSSSREVKNVLKNNRVDNVETPRFNAKDESNKVGNLDVENSRRNAKDENKVGNLENSLMNAKFEELYGMFKEMKIEGTEPKMVENVTIRERPQGRVDEHFSPSEMKPKKPKKPAMQTQKLEFDITKNTCIAVGPPEVDLVSLNKKIIPNETFLVAGTVTEMLGKPVENHFTAKDDDFDLDIPKLKERTIDEVKQSQTKTAMPVDSNNSLNKSTARKDVRSPGDENTAIDNKYMQRYSQLEDKNTNQDKQRYSRSPDIPKSKVQPAVPSTTNTSDGKITSNLLRKMQAYKDSIAKADSASTVSGISTNYSTSGAKEKTEEDSDDENDREVIEKINREYPKPIVTETVKEHKVLEKNHVNPFKNVDPNLSVFVDKLVTPILMVHSKLNKRFQPSFEIREVNFNSHIQITLKNMNVEKPMTLQTLSWMSILRGYSTFLISPKGSGKTMGYLPAVCNLVNDGDCIIPGTGPLCIIVCATAKSVAFVERIAKVFLSKHKVLACYTGMDELDMTTSLLNGCDLLIITPSLLVRLLQSVEFGVDLSRLCTFVLDDCERLAEVYTTEVRFFLVKIKEMLRNRTVKELKVQFVLASRVWCDFMEPLAKKVPDTVVSIGAFQECVLYSKANMTASFVTKDMKINSVLEFLKQVDISKRTVIVCRLDEEVVLVEKALTEMKYHVFSCDSTMTVTDLYNLSAAWNDHKETLAGSGPIMVCRDENLHHMNITDAHNLVQYSLPNYYSSFSKRFSVLTNYYPSIFKEQNETVNIKILMDEDNVDQLPKIVHYIKRCTREVPQRLEAICNAVISNRELNKAENLVPVCNNVLALGECPDFWNCQERHILSKEHDTPEEWVPTNGVITFKIIHYHNAAMYSANLLTHTVKGEKKKFPQPYKMLSMQIAMYYGVEANKRLHGIPKVGDVCAVCIRQNFYLRCQVIKLLDYYPNKAPNHVLVKLIDEERLETTRDVYLYHLPEKMKCVKNYVVQIRLANVQPKDKDITFSHIAKDQLEMISGSDLDLYFRAPVSLTIGNCIFVDKLESCKDLTAATERTIIKHDFRQELSAHATENKDHLPKLRKLCTDSGIDVVKEEVCEVVKPVKRVFKPQWAHLEQDDFSLVYFASAMDPGLFFVRPVKFSSSSASLNKEIEKYTETNKDVLTDPDVGDIVLAKYPGSSFERARIDDIMNDRVNCFFVDQGDWMEVPNQDLKPIPEKFVTQLPFQAIECRLYGVAPVGEDWTEFSTTWLSNQFESDTGDLKQMYIKYMAKERSLYTHGNKYAIVIFDTTKEEDRNLNKILVDLNLGRPDDVEWGKLDELTFNNSTTESQDEISDGEKSWENVRSTSDTPEMLPAPSVPFDDLFPKKPLRTFHMDDFDSDEDMEINEIEDFIKLLKPATDNAKFGLPDVKSIDPKSVDTKPNTLEVKNVDSNSVDAELSLLNAKDVDSISLDTDKSSIVLLSNADENSNVSSAQSTKKIVEVTSDTSSVKKPADFKVLSKSLDSDDLTSPEQSVLSSEKNKDAELRKPKLLWRQRDYNVTIKIMLIGAECYKVDVNMRSIKFRGTANDTNYGFDLELYGVIKPDKCSHENKGQYILVKLERVIKRNWFTLTKSGIYKWIQYDVDSIDVSSDEEDSPQVITREMIKSESESETEDENFMDDATFTYKR